MEIVKRNYVREECQRKLEMVKKAHADGDFSVREIIKGQKEYQHWLFKEYNGDIKKIMSVNRSIGLEFEFASYKFNNGDESKQYPAHIELGKSENFSPLFNIPFMLETDVHNELEIGFPPFLIANVNGEMNKGAISRIWKSLRKTMQEINKEALECNIQKLTMIFEAYGLESEWRISNKSRDLKVAKRKKHCTIQNQVYSQLNISLTAKEIAELTKKYGLSAYIPEMFKYFSETFNLLYKILAKNISTRMGETAIVHICKGLSNLLAIPSLLLLKDQPESRQNNRGVYSGVKETFGVWVKDSILNLIDNSLNDQQARDEVKQVVIEEKLALDDIMQEQIEKAMKIVRTQFGFKEEYKNIALTEYLNTISELVKRLNNNTPKYIPNRRDVLYKSESFPAQGKGVRRDTYVNISSPTGVQFHLAEIRNDDQIENFISY